MRAGSDVQTSAPDWDLIPFDVGCARCGHDLRGLTEPLCPACGLSFDWSVAVPIDELRCLKCDYRLFGLHDLRCPECGTEFTWESVLDEHYRDRKSVFEYNWRKRPVRSLLGTVWLAVRPYRLWSVLDIHDPPRVGPLLVLLVVAMLAVHVLIATTVALDNMWDYLFWNSWTEAVLQALGDWWSTFVSITSVWVALPMIIYTAVAFASILLLRQTMAKCRIRAIHVLRVCVLSVPLGFVLAFCAMTALSAAELDTAMEYCGPFIALGALAFVVWSITLACKRYLCIPHCFGVAFVSQIIAALALLTLTSIMAIARMS